MKKKTPSVLLIILISVDFVIYSRYKNSFYFRITKFKNNEMLFFMLSPAFHHLELL